VKRLAGEGGIALIGLSIALANVTNAAASNASLPAASVPADAIWWPAWVLVAGVLIALAAGLGLLAALRAELTAKPKSRDKEFARMLCDQVWAHTDTMTNVFAQRMRQSPADIVTLRVLIRNLREDLSGPVHFVDQMQGHAPQTWPKYGLFGAFTNWGGQLKALESQLGDLQHAVTYPVVKEPVDKNRDAMLVHHYLTEQAVLGRAIGQLRAHAFAVCAAAKKSLGGKKSGHSHDEDEDGHANCPCCNRVADHPEPPVKDPFDIVLPPLPVLAPPPAPPAPPVPAKVCACPAPRLCHCAQACICVCACATPAPVPAIAHQPASG
jgi:hypothetical protein